MVDVDLSWMKTCSRKVSVGDLSAAVSLIIGISLASDNNNLISIKNHNLQE